MKYRKLASTDLYASEIGFGTWGIGGVVEGLKAYGPKDDKISYRALERAYNLGINYFDTACNYGFGHSEKLIATVFRHFRKSIIIATKGGYLNYFPKDGVNQKFDVESIRKSLLESLLRLQTNYVDIFQLHSPDFEYLVKNDELFIFLIEAKKAGIIRYIGYAARHPHDIPKLFQLKDFKFDFVQFCFNLTDMRARDLRLFELCTKENVAVATRSPLVHGFLTGKLNAESTFHPSDHRNRFLLSTREKWLSALNLYKNVFKGGSPAQNAIRFCLSWETPSVILTGMNNPEQVSENTEASDLPKLTECELEAILSIYDKNFHDYKPETNTRK